MCFCIVAVILIYVLYLNCDNDNLHEMLVCMLDLDLELFQSLKLNSMPSLASSALLECYRDDGYIHIKKFIYYFRNSVQATISYVHVNA